MFSAICGLFGILLVIYALVGVATLVFNVCMSLGVVGLVILVAMAIYGLKWVYYRHKKSPTRSVNTGGGSLLVLWYVMELKYVSIWWRYLLSPHSKIILRV